MGSNPSHVRDQWSTIWDILATQAVWIVAVESIEKKKVHIRRAHTLSGYVSKLCIQKFLKVTVFVFIKLNKSIQKQNKIYKIRNIIVLLDYLPINELYPVIDST